MVAQGEVQARKMAGRPHSVGAVPVRQRAPAKDILAPAKPGPRKILRKMPTDESLKKEFTPLPQRCNSEGPSGKRPGTAPEPRWRKMMVSKSDQDAAFQLSHLKRSAAYSMPKCPSRGALSINRNSWFPMTNSQVNGGSGPGPAEANLRAMGHKGKINGGPSHSIGTAPRFRAKSLTREGQKPAHVEGDGFVLKTYTTFGKSANHPMRSKSPAHGFPRANRFFSAW